MKKTALLILMATALLSCEKESELKMQEASSLSQREQQKDKKSKSERTLSQIYKLRKGFQCTLLNIDTGATSRIFYTKKVRRSQKKKLAHAFYTINKKTKNASLGINILNRKIWSTSYKSLKDNEYEAFPTLFSKDGKKRKKKRGRGRVKVQLAEVIFDSRLNEFDIALKEIIYRGGVPSRKTRDRVDNTIHNFNIDDCTKSKQKVMVVL